MINFDRTKENKWIMQKNISSSELLETFVSGLSNQNNIIELQKFGKYYFFGRESIIKFRYIFD